MKGVLIAGGAAALLMLLPFAATSQVKPKPDLGRGEAIFEERCQSCHVSEGGGQGPTLVGVVGRHAAAVPGVIYSRALRASNLTWSPGELDKFLAAPTAVVPGTAMPLAVPNAKDRLDLIGYLASLLNKR